MGLLSLGTPLDWHTSRQHNEHVRASGIDQLINIFRQHADRRQDHFYWGDEVEYMLVDVDPQAKTARLAIDKDYILDDLNNPEKPDFYNRALDSNTSFHPEYGRFMIEATPLRPYDGTCLADYHYVEQNMVLRREVAKSVLPPNIVPVTLTSYPRMGCGDFTSPTAKPIGPASQSLFLPDEIINRHARFPTLTANIRKRRGRKVAINLPLYPDTNTKLMDDSIPKRDLFPSDKEPWLGASKPGHVYMDSMGFGMGSSCLQVTMQAADISQARYLYDSLAPLTPVMLAVSAAAPIFKGFLVDQDVRWNVISGAVDDRTFVEEDLEPFRGYHLFGGLDVADALKKHIEHLGGGRGVNGDKLTNKYGDTAMVTVDGKPIQKVPKSRYDSIDSYLSDEKYAKKKPYFKLAYNDIFSPVNKKVSDKLAGDDHFDDALTHHFAHLFIRDPLVIFSERVSQDNTLENDHFENIQLTNWQTLRFKPPALYPPGTSINELASKPGWRVEFRPMEIQLNDFENAAYSVFLILASQAILEFSPDFYIPILRIDENMKIAHKVDAAINDTFWFKNPSKWNVDCESFKGFDLSWFDRCLNDGNDLFCDNGVYLNGYPEGTKDSCTDGLDDEPNEVRLTADEIINGLGRYPGLIKMIVKYVSLKLVSDKTHCHSTATAKHLLAIQSYLKLVSGRASGKIPTTAHFIRDFVLRHPEYKKDSKVSDKINYDLIQMAIAVTDFDVAQPELLKNFFGEATFAYLNSRQTHAKNGSAKNEYAKNGYT